MPKRAAGPPLALLRLDRALPVPLHRQLYDELRAAVLTGRLRPGVRLPSTRTLASELGVSRRTVLDAFLQLYAEGYVEGRTGAGTFVAHTPSEALLQPTPTGPRDNRRGGTPALGPLSPPARRRSHSPGRVVAAGARAARVHAGVPALDEFPTAPLGASCVAAGRGGLRDEAFFRAHRAGYGPLREAIAGYLAAARGVRCTADQVIVVNGSQQALTLITHVLLDPGEAAWVRSPATSGRRGRCSERGRASSRCPWTATVSTWRPDGRCAPTPVWRS